MKKDAPLKWDERYQNTFEIIKKHLLNQPILGAPVPEKPLILYIIAQERSIGAFMAQENEEGKENALYYLSRSLIENELKYSPVEKICLTLFYAIKKLRHYFEAYSIRLISQANLVKFVISRLVLSGRLAWKITFILQKVVKGQVLADFLANHLIPAQWELSDDLPAEDVFYNEVLPTWTLFFDEAARFDGQVLTYSFVLGELCSNNIVEYQTVIIELQMALEMNITEVEIYGDSRLVVNQLLNIYENLLKKFESFSLGHIPRKEDRMVDTLANLATALALSEGEAMSVPICNRWVVPMLNRTNHEDSNAVSVLTNDVQDWRKPPIDYLKHGRLPSNTRHSTEIRWRSSHFVLYKDNLYQRSYEGNYQCCLSDEETIKAMTEAHSGVCGAHQSDPKLHFQIKRMEPLHPTVASWPFDAWGLDVVGPITPKSSVGHAYILAEVVPLRKVKKKTVVEFIRSNLSFGYGIPRYIITDNRKIFYNKLMDRLCVQFDFKQHNSFMYNAVANVYGIEAVLGLENQIPSLRVAVLEGLMIEDNAGLRLEKLEALDEKKLQAQQQLECYQACMTRAFNQKVHPRSYQIRDLVLVVRKLITITQRMGNKFISKCDSPYAVQEVYTNGAYKLVDKDGLRVGLINGKFLKRYYP
ncbi:Ribonuclease H [Handroanthus impetiginosus]|uniref:Ribonuclease H n=1 Tax=Handroanthus impetiginosus TaxID=429701 RepID=A0A2G9HZC2_9LAMI|nr:Ribonuclease H [Handroanthus impetiginosus]